LTTPTCEKVAALTTGLLAKDDHDLVSTNSTSFVCTITFNPWMTHVRFLITRASRGDVRFLITRASRGDVRFLITRASRGDVRSLITRA